VYQVLFKLPFFDVPIFGFGMMLFLAFVVCTWLSGRRAENEGISKEVPQDLAIWLFAGGIAGARLTFLLANDIPLSHFVFIWDGGLILYGSFVGGLLGYLGAYYFVLRKRGVSTWKLLDVIAPSVAVGICLGRVGCLLNGCCYGAVACPECPAVPYPLSAPARYHLVGAGHQTAAGFTLAGSERDAARVAVVTPDSPAQRAGLQTGDRIVEADGRPIRDGFDLSLYLGDSQTWPRGKSDLQLTVTRDGVGEPIVLPAFRPWTLGLHPTQIYESISMVLLLLVMLAYDPLRRRDGELMAIMMIGYGVHRYVNELLRNDPRPKGFESYVSLLLIGGGLVLWAYLWRFRPARPLAT
jgi:phosphatidylglycerol---prolipoprotein diacylglyceryl transferase